MGTASAVVREGADRAGAAGHADSQYRLGCYADSGLGTLRDAAMAAEYFRFAALQVRAPDATRGAVLRLCAQGHSKAQVSLGAALYNGEGVPKDARMAVYWFRKGAQLCNAA